MVTSGLVLFGSAFLWISGVGVDRVVPSVIVPQMVLMGLGMGLISTPATESILLVLPPARAGVGSAVNDATRELGGTLGVAVIGSVFSSVYAARLAEGRFADLPAPVLARAQDSVGAAGQIAARADLVGPMQEAFLAGLHAGCVVIGVLCLLGAAAAALTLPGRETRAPSEPVDLAPGPGPERTRPRVLPGNGPARS